MVAMSTKRETSRAPVFAGIAASEPPDAPSSEDAVTGLRLSGLEVVDIRDLAGGERLPAWLDGLVRGFAAAPTRWQVLRIETCTDAAFDRLEALRRDMGEGTAFRRWSPTGYAAAQRAMDETGLKHHCQLILSPGARRRLIIRTTYVRRALR